MRTANWLFLLVSTTLCAHDMWIEPVSFTPPVGQIVGLKLRVGQELLGDAIPHTAALVKEFVIDDGTGKKPVVARPGSDPAGMFRTGAPGLTIAGYASHPSSVEMAAEKFNAYLKEEGLDSILAVRAKNNQMGLGAKELFARCAKALISAGEGLPVTNDHALGFTLELVAERNPYAMQAGQQLPLRLTYEGRPLAGALVVAMNRRNPAQKILARTNAQGRVALALPASGMWMVKAVHMVAAAAKEAGGVPADWLSYWASLTFELPAAPEKKS
jgi:Domain of unknown function (DUF4198)